MPVVGIAQSEPIRPILRALVLDDQAIAIDGRLAEPAWAVVDGRRTLAQQRPAEGAPATEQSSIHVGFAEGSLFVAVRLDDRAPDSLVARLTRRDREDGSDEFVLYLDPLGDGRTGYWFAVSAAGVQRDETLDNEVSEDDAWDAVWASAVARDSSGWTVEIRTAISQMRTATGTRTPWGIKFSRFIGRRNGCRTLFPGLGP